MVDDREAGKADGHRHRVFQFLAGKEDKGGTADRVEMAGTVDKAAQVHGTAHGLRNVGRIRSNVPICAAGVQVPLLTHHGHCVRDENGGHRTKPLIRAAVHAIHGINPLD